MPIYLHYIQRSLLKQTTNNVLPRDFCNRNFVDSIAHLIYAVHLIVNHVLLKLVCLQSLVQQIHQKRVNENGNLFVNYSTYSKIYRSTYFHSSHLISIPIHRIDKVQIFLLILLVLTIFASVILISSMETSHNQRHHSNCLYQQFIKCFFFSVIYNKVPSFLELFK